MTRCAVFLDRDGTLVAEREDWLLSPRDVRLLPGSAAAVRRLNEAGYVVVLLTNQSAVARGLLPEAGLAAIHDELHRRLARHGAHLDAVYYCPHHPTAGRGRYRRDCVCRKPGKGMLEAACRDLDLALPGSAVVGDDLRDVLIARDTPLRPFLVRTGKGRQREQAAQAELGDRCVVVDRLADAVDRLLGDRDHGPRMTRVPAQGR